MGGGPVGIAGSWEEVLLPQLTSALNHPMLFAPPFDFAKVCLPLPSPRPAGGDDDDGGDVQQLGGGGLAGLRGVPGSPYWPPSVSFLDMTWPRPGTQTSPPHRRTWQLLAVEAL